MLANGYESSGEEYGVTPGSSCGKLKEAEGSLDQCDDCDSSTDLHLESQTISIVSLAVNADC